MEPEEYPLDDEDIKDEILFERFLAIKDVVEHKQPAKLPERESIRRDLSELYELKTVELKFRKVVANRLWLMRDEAKNGYRHLRPSEQEKILNCRVGFIGYLFGNDDIFSSRRKLALYEGYKPILPLRKEVTMRVIRAYNPKELLLKQPQAQNSQTKKLKSLSEFLHK